MISIVQAYKRVDPAARNSWEILLLYPGVKAIFFHRIAHFLHRYRIPFLPRLISEISRWLTGIEIHPGAVIGADLVIDHGMGVVIGETAVVGNQVTIYQGVTLGGTQLIQAKRHPTVHDGVMLGAGCKILGNIVIGKNAKVGANSVVINHVAPDSIVAGIPAKMIQRESPENEWGIEYYI